MDDVLRIILFIVPVVYAGICNMIFVKLPLLNFLFHPIDNRMLLRDGKRLFGDNKTWKGFTGMIVFSVFWITCSTSVYIIAGLQPYLLVPIEKLSPLYMIPFFGSLIGIGYVVFELPNSFFKRRIDIPPGKNVPSFIGYFFTFVDQCDSVVGIMVFISFVHILDIKEYILLFLIGTGIHYIINILLYFVGLKKQAA